VPFQDNAVVDLALSLPYGAKAPRGRPKHLLKEAFRDQLPDFVRDRPKRPFAAPMSGWAKGALRELIRDTLDRDAIGAAGLVDADAAVHALDPANSLNRRPVDRLWALLLLHLWHDGLRAASADAATRDRTLAAS